MHFSHSCKLQNDEKWKCARQKFCAALLLSSQIMFGPSFFFVFFLDQKWSSGAQKWCRKVDKSFDRQLLCVSFQPFVLSQLSAAIELLGFPQCVIISFSVRKFNMLKTRIKKSIWFYIAKIGYFYSNFRAFLNGQKISFWCSVPPPSSYRKTFCWYFGLIHFVYIVFHKNLPSK